MGPLAVVITGAPEGGLEQDAAHEGRTGEGQILLTVFQGEAAVHRADHEAVGVQVHRGDMLHQTAELAHTDRLGQGGDFIDLILLKALHPKLLIAGSRVDQPVEHAAQGHGPVADLPAGLRPPEDTELEDLAVLLIKLRLGQDLLFLHRQQMLQIQLIAQAPEEGHIAPGSQGGGPKGLGMGRGGDMGAHGGLRIEVTEALLDIQALDRVRVVGAPDLGRIAEHAQVEPVAAGGAALEEDLFSRPEDPAQHLIQAQDIPVGLGAQGNAMAVHVPFHIGDRGGVQHTGHIFHDVVPDLLLRQVQQQLMAAQDRLEAVGEGPFRVGPVEVGIRVDGLRLEPEAEPHPQALHLVPQALEAVGQFFHIHIIVAQTGPVIIALAEPAVVQDKELAAQLLCPHRQIHQAAVGKVEHQALPVVEEHRPFPLPPVFGDDMVHDKGMHPPGQLTEAAVRVAEHRLGGLEAFAGLQLLTEFGGIDALHHPGQALEGPLGGGVMVAGIDHIEAVDPSSGLRGILFVEQEAEIAAVGGSAGAALQYHPCVGDGGIPAAHLRDPAAVEGGHMEAAGNIQLEAHELIQGDGLGAGVLQHRPAGQGGLIGGVDQGQLQSFLPQGQLQLLLAPMGHGQASLRHL